jgi:GNAT superfamily N-acetyltransferase
MARGSEPVTVRRELRPGDVEAIAAMHGETYGREYGVNSSFEGDVVRNLEAAIDTGWPERGSLWLVEHDGELAGSLALTEESAGVACVRWFLLVPAVRGGGLGRRLVTELVSEADAAGYELVHLMTFSELRAAAHIYRTVGFEVTGSREDDRWGRPLTFQTYERRRP